MDELGGNIRFYCLVPSDLAIENGCKYVLNTFIDERSPVQFLIRPWDPQMRSDEHVIESDQPYNERMTDGKTSRKLLSQKISI